MREFGFFALDLRREGRKARTRLDGLGSCFMCNFLAPFIWTVSEGCFDFYCSLYWYLAEILSYLRERRH